jgi:hypothetical protein
VTSLYIPAAEPRQAKLACTKCGAQTDAPCSCGAAYKPVEVAKEAIKANPQKSNRAIAKETGISEPTVRRARASGDAPADNVIGLDGKSYKAKAKKPRPDIEALKARAESIGWTFSSFGNGKFVVSKTLGEPCPEFGGQNIWLVRTTLRDAPALLDDIEAHPDQFGPQDEPRAGQDITPIEEHRAAMAALDEPAPAAEPIDKPKRMTRAEKHAAMRQVVDARRAAEPDEKKSAHALRELLFAVNYWGLQLNAKHREQAIERIKAALAIGDAS